MGRPTTGRRRKKVDTGTSPSFVLPTSSWTILMPIPAIDPHVTIPMATPFDDQDRVDHDAIGRNIERWLPSPLTGFIVGSATGEEYMLSEEEKLAITRTV